MKTNPLTETPGLYQAISPSVRSSGGGSFVAIILLALLFVSLLDCPVHAHAFGRIGVDNYVCISPLSSGIEIMHDMHLGELPTAALMARLDADRDGELSREELLPYMEKSALVYADGFDVLVTCGEDREQLDLSLPPGGLFDHCKTRIVNGSQGERTLRIQWRFKAQWPDSVTRAKQFLIEVSRQFSGMASASWIFVHGTGNECLSVLRHSVPSSAEVPLPPDLTEPASDPSKAPNDSYASLLVSNAGGNGTDAPNPSLVGKSLSGEGGGVAGRDAEGGGPRDDALRQRILDRARSLREGGSYSLLALLCFAWGALHAFAPGHGKAIAGTYLISTQASYRHAVLLGVLMTMTHTAVILVLAMAATILKDRFVYPEWLQYVGAVLILIVGLRQLMVGIRAFLGLGPAHGHHHHHPDQHHHHGDGHAHSHEHGSHAHAHIEGSVAGRDIAAVGLSGGLVPCPAAIVLFLLTLQLGMPAFGLVLILCFSLGLALTIIAFGFVAITGTKVILRWISKPESDHASRKLVSAVAPVVGGLLLLTFGFIILLS